jgi:hypothetical protein
MVVRFLVSLSICVATFGGCMKNESGAQTSAFDSKKLSEFSKEGGKVTMDLDLTQSCISKIKERNSMSGIDNPFQPADRPVALTCKFNENTLTCKSSTKTFSKMGRVVPACYSIEGKANTKPKPESPTAVTEQCKPRTCGVSFVNFEGQSETVSCEVLKKCKATALCKPLIAKGLPENQFQAPLHIVEVTSELIAEWGKNDGYKPGDARGYIHFAGSLNCGDVIEFEASDGATPSNPGLEDSSENDEAASDGNEPLWLK